MKQVYYKMIKILIVGEKLKDVTMTEMPLLT